MSNMLMNCIKRVCNDACLESYQINVKCVVIDTDIHLNGKAYQISICIEESETGRYLITESDIEIPANKKIRIPSVFKEFIMIESIHDWSKELNALHYHIVSTRASRIGMLKQLLHFLLTIHFHLYNNIIV